MNGNKTGLGQMTFISILPYLFKIILITISLKILNKTEWEKVGMLISYICLISPHLTFSYKKN